MLRLGLLALVCALKCKLVTLLELSHGSALCTQLGAQSQITSLVLLNNRMLCRDIVDVQASYSWKGLVRLSGICGW